MREGRVRNGPIGAAGRVALGFLTGWVALGFNPEVAHGEQGSPGFQAEAFVQGRGLQEADTLLADPQVSPGGAFLRSLVLPGWGHAVTGSHGRGAFYVTAQSGSAWMIAKSMARRREARGFRDEELRIARDRLRAAGIVSPDTLRLRAAADPRVEEWEELIDARSQQVEDWAALSIFLLLLGATDAFVAGHMMDRPEPLTIRVGPSLDRGWELGLSLRPGMLRLRP